MTDGSTVIHVYLPAMPTFDVRNPATSKVIARVPDGTTNDAARAVSAASMMLPAVIVKSCGSAELVRAALTGSVCSM